MVWVIFLPFVGFLKWFGFTAMGPAAGSWAAYWMSFYAGAVPTTGLFASLQAWGMTSSVAWLGMWIYAPFAAVLSWLGLSKLF